MACDFFKSWSLSRYGSTKWYGYSKLCNIYFARELARRMKEKGVKVYANTLHPGGGSDSGMRCHVQVEY